MSADNHDMNYSAETFVVSGGRPAHEHDAPVNPPIVLSSTYRGVDAVNIEQDRVYARFSNPTWEGMEEVVAKLENATQPGLLFPSGMAAVAAVIDLVPVGSIVLIPKHAYMASVALLSAARRLGIVTAVDNTFATPILQRPLDLGADVVVHSATKFLAGHSDVLLGMALTSNEELYKAMLHHRITNGAIPGPVEAWLGLRGLRTLALRVERAVQNAQALAERLSEHPFVTEVRYPGLESDRGHEVAKKQMDGFGAILCVTLDTDAAGARNVVEALKLWTPATSLGGVESLVERRRRHGNEPDSIPESLLRLSVGIENVDDLYNDLVEAFKAVR